MLLIRKFSTTLLFKLIVLLSACTALIAFGVVGIGRSGGFSGSNFDMKFLYFGGLAWLKGLNAYDPVVISQIGQVNAEQGGFFYPPQIAPLCLLLASFSWEKAKVIMILLNFLCIGVLAFFSTRFIKYPEVRSLKSLVKYDWWLIPAIVICNPFTLHVVYMGQTSLIAGAVLVSGWYFVRRDHDVLGGILLGISTIKPQFSILIILWILLERQWRVLASIVITILVCSFFPMIIQGPLDVFVQWFHSLEIHKNLIYNSPSFRHVFSLQSFLDAAGIKSPNLLPVSILLTCGLYWYRHHLVDDDILVILLAISLLFGVAHDYDLAILIRPFIASFWKYLSFLPRRKLILVSLMLALVFPQRFLRGFQIDLLLQWRVAVLLGSLIWLVLLSVDQAKKFSPMTSER